VRKRLGRRYGGEGGSGPTDSGLRFVPPRHHA
jgi:hypothetical protein